MTKLTLPSGEWMMVKVSRKGINFSFVSGQSAVGYGGDMLRWWVRSINHHRYISLPPGNYSLYGADPLMLTEKEWANLVEWQFDTCRNYEDTDDMDNLSCYTHINPSESGHSLIRANGYEVGECILLKVNK